MSPIYHLIPGTTRSQLLDRDGRKETSFLCVTGSQCCRRGVTWSHGLRSRTVFAAVYIYLCAKMLMSSLADQHEQRCSGPGVTAATNPRLLSQHLWTPHRSFTEAVSVNCSFYAFTVYAALEALRCRLIRRGFHPVPNRFLSLCKNTEQISMKFTGGNSDHKQLKWLHFGRNWNGNNGAGYERKIESTSTDVLLRCQIAADT